jgi:hypothetical protein
MYVGIWSVRSPLPRIDPSLKTGGGGVFAWFPSGVPPESHASHFLTGIERPRMRVFLVVVVRRPGRHVIVHDRVVHCCCHWRHFVVSHERERGDPAAVVTRSTFVVNDFRHVVAPCLCKTEKRKKHEADCR